MMRIFVAACLLAFITACSGQTESNSDQGVIALQTSESLETDTQLAAVFVYADWCGSCKVLGPKVLTAAAQGPIDGLQHFVLDYTARDDDAFFAAADSIGLGAPIRVKLEAGVKTGILLLVDVDEGKIVGDLRKTLSPNEIRAAMVETAAAA